MDEGGGVFPRLQIVDDLRQLADVLRCFDQKKFEQSVLQIHHVAVKAKHAADGGRVACGEEDIIVLIYRAVGFDTHMNGAQLGQGANAFQNVREMTDGIFHLSRCGIGCAGKCTAASDVREALAAEIADV